MPPAPSEVTVHAISDLRTRGVPLPACPPLSCGVAVLCHDTDGDGGGGDFVWGPGATAADNDGTVVRSTVAGAPQGAWKRVYSGPIDVRWFGAKGDGIADDYGAIQAADDTPQEVIIDSCEIRGSHTAPLTEPIVYIRNTACTFVNNKIFLPAAAHAGATYMVAVLIQDVRLSRNNQFDTDLVPSGNEHFCTAYASTIGAITVDDDLYVPQGSSPSFRPEPNATWDNTYPYSAGKTSSGAIPMGSALMNPGPMGAGAVWQSPWVAVNGASVNDPVLVGAPPAIEVGLLWSAYVSSAGLVTLRLLNQSGGPITPAPATWKFTVLH